MTATTRRRLLRQAGGLALAGLARPRLAHAAAGEPVGIAMRSDRLGARVWFDPIGVLIEPGQTVRWVNDGNNVHTSTAYHPANADHPLRIPEDALPWDSGYLADPGARFEVTLTVPGVYDYFCTPHEAAGMVGRIVVGEPSGPGALPFGYWQGGPTARDWRPVPDVARAAFPTIDEIMRRRVVRLDGA